MLVLRRKEGESFMIADGVEVVVLNIRPKQVRLGIAAPDSIRVTRKEKHEPAFLGIACLKEAQEQAAGVC